MQRNIPMRCKNIVRTISVAAGPRLLFASSLSRAVCLWLSIRTCCANKDCAYFGVFLHSLCCRSRLAAEKGKPLFWYTSKRRMLTEVLLPVFVGRLPHSRKHAHTHSHTHSRDVVSMSWAFWRALKKRAPETLPTVQ